MLTCITVDDSMRIGYHKRSPVRWYDDREITPELSAVLALDYIVLAGGALVSMSTGQSVSDYDLFFVGVADEDLDQCLVTAISTLVLAAFKNEQKCYITRNRRVVNVYVMSRWGCGNKYQFILRSYPRKDLVVGGFDIGVCGILHDGKSVWMTDMAAWQLKNQTIIVDISRRSPSYKARLNKYVRRGFNVVFPGCNAYRAEIDVRERDALIDKLCVDDTDSDSKDSYVNGIIEKAGLSDLGYKLCRQYYIEDTYYHGWGQPKDPNISTKLWTLNCLIRQHEGTEYAYSMADLRNILSDNPYTYVYKQEWITQPIGDMMTGVPGTIGVSHTKYRAQSSDYADVSEQLYIEESNTLMLSRKKTDYVVTVLKLSERPNDEYNEIKSSANIVPDQIRNFLFTEDPPIPYVSWGWYGRARKVKQITVDQAKAKLKGIHWITENPGRQWTSSSDPLEDNNTAFYGGLWNGLTIGVTHPGVLCPLILWNRGRKYTESDYDPNNGFAILDRGVVMKIVKLAIWSYHGDQVDIVQLV